MTCALSRSSHVFAAVQLEAVTFLAPNGLRIQVKELVLLIHQHLQQFCFSCRWLLLSLADTVHRPIYYVFRFKRVLINICNMAGRVLNIVRAFFEHVSQLVVRQTLGLLVTWVSLALRLLLDRSLRLRRRLYPNEVGV